MAESGRIMSGDVPSLERLFLCSMDTCFLREEDEDEHDDAIPDGTDEVLEFFETVQPHPRLALVCFGHYCSYAPECYSEDHKLRRMFGETSTTSELGPYSCIRLVRNLPFETEFTRLAFDGALVPPPSSAPHFLNRAPCIAEFNAAPPHAYAQPARRGPRETGDIECMCFSGF